MHCGKVAGCSRVVPNAEVQKQLKCLLRVDLGSGMKTADRRWPVSGDTVTDCVLCSCHTATMSAQTPPALHTAHTTHHSRKNTHLKGQVAASDSQQIFLIYKFDHSTSIQLHMIAEHIEPTQQFLTFAMQCNVLLHRNKYLKAVLFCVLFWS